VEVIKLQAIVRQHLKRRRIAGTTERARRAEPDVIQQHEQHIRSTGRSFQWLRKVGPRLLCSQVHRAPEWLWGTWQNILSRNDGTDVDHEHQRKNTWKATWLQG
jgi:hypothetical protein